MNKIQTRYLTEVLLFLDIITIFKSSDNNEVYTLINLELTLTSFVSVSFNYATILQILHVFIEHKAIQCHFKTHNALVV